MPADTAETLEPQRTTGPSLDVASVNLFEDTFSPPSSSGLQRDTEKDEDATRPTASSQLEAPVPPASDSHPQRDTSTPGGDRSSDSDDLSSSEQGTANALFMDAYSLFANASKPERATAESADQSIGAPEPENLPEIGRGGDPARRTGDASIGNSRIARPQDSSRQVPISDTRLAVELTQFEQGLAKMGMSPASAHEVSLNLRHTFNRLEKVDPERFGKPSPTTQLQRIMGDMSRVMDSDGVIDGQLVLSQSDQNKIVEDMARSAADPEKYVNQGNHNDCVAQSNRIAHMTTDAADAIRIGADIATTGRTLLLGAPGDTPVKVKVDTQSIKLDPESRRSTAVSSEAGDRTAFGQMYGLAANEGTNNEKARRTFPDGSVRFLYQQLTNPKPSDSGERFWRYQKQQDGTFGNGTVIGMSPQTDSHDAARMARITMGETSGLFIYSPDSDKSFPGGEAAFMDPELNKKFLEDQKKEEATSAEESKNIEGVDYYSTDPQLRKLAQEYQDRTGRPGRYMVHISKLPEVNASPKDDLHQMTLKFKNDTGTFDDDGQTWGTQRDRPGKDMTAQEVIHAARHDRPAELSPPAPVASPIASREQHALEAGLSIESLRVLYGLP